MSIISSSKVIWFRTESSKLQPSFLSSKQNGKHQTVRNLKLQFSVNGLKVENIGRYRNLVVCGGSGPQIPSDSNPEEVDTAIDKVEAVTDVVEKVAEQVEKMADEIDDHLPEGKFKDAIEFVEDVAEEAAETAHLAGELIDKVEDVENSLESFMESANGEEKNEKKEEGKTESESQTHA